LDEECHKFAFKQLNEVRAAGIRADLYPSPAKMKKQMKYANDIDVPYVAIIGSEEMSANQFAVKSMEDGNQAKMTLSELMDKLKS
ncbi:MAG: His/Gly/Thr/Pro-type tRNA ligase C-terminal domain-containing protein, partial [Saprospiraceae bacterium]